MRRFLLFALPLLILAMALFNFALEAFGLAPDSALLARLGGAGSHNLPSWIVLATWGLEALGLSTLFLLVRRPGREMTDGLLTGWIAWVFRGPLLVVAVVGFGGVKPGPWWSMAFSWSSSTHSAACCSASSRKARRCGLERAGNGRQGRRKPQPLKIAAIGKALPPHYYDQEALLLALKRRWSPRLFNAERLERLHKNVLVGGRHLALPIEEYETLSTWGRANDAWIRVAQEVGAAAVEDALGQAGLAAADVDALIFVTVTGVATPSIDARLMNRLALPPRLRRIPIFGLGCAAGAAGLGRAADYVRAYPDQVAVLLSVELCSLTFQPEDLSIPNLFASGLFGDGAAAVLVVGDGRNAAGPEIVDSPLGFLPRLRTGSRLGHLRRGLPSGALGRRAADGARQPPGDVDAFLADHGLRRADIASWVCHPGGPKIIDAMAEALELPAAALALTWKSLRELGNVSSASVLLILEEIAADHRPPPGSHGVLLAVGPGFGLELVLLRW